MVSIQRQSSISDYFHSSNAGLYVGMNGTFDKASRVIYLDVVEEADYRAKQSKINKLDEYFEVSIRKQGRIVASMII